MGASPPHPSIETSSDVLDLLDLLIRTEIGADPSSWSATRTGATSPAESPAVTQTKSPAWR